MQKTASVSHFLFEGALGNSALLLLYFDFRLGERALRPAQLLYEQPFAFLTISDAGEVKRRRGIPLPRSGFCTVVHVRPPQSSAATSHFRMALTKSRRRAEPSAA